VLPVRYELLQVASISQLNVSRLSRQCGILNIAQPYRPPRPFTGIALLFLLYVYTRHSLKTLNATENEQDRSD
jgi:hypothetical protein